MVWRFGQTLAAQHCCVYRGRAEGLKGVAGRNSRATTQFILITGPAPQLDTAHCTPTRGQHKLLRDGFIYYSSYFWWNFPRKGAGGTANPPEIFEKHA